MDLGYLDIQVPSGAKAHGAQILPVEPDPDESDDAPRRPKDLGGATAPSTADLLWLHMGEPTNNQKRLQYGPNEDVTQIQ